MYSVRVHARACVFDNKNNFALITFVCNIIITFNALNTVIGNLKICLEKTKLFLKPIVYIAHDNK